MAREGEGEVEQARIEGTNKSRPETAWNFRYLVLRTG